MEIHQLEYFLAVADTGSFTRASERVRIVQSAVSSGVRQLEKDVGCELFERAHRGITLTAEGRAFLPHAREALSSLAAARDAVASARGSIVGTVTLGTMAHMGAFDVAAVLEEIHTRYPAIIVKLRQTSAGSRSSMAEVRAGRLDLAIVSPVTRRVPGIVLEPVLSEPLVFVCWPHHRLASLNRVTAADAADEEFVDFPDGWGNRELTDRFFNEGGVQRAINMEVTDFALALALVRRRLGVTILPTSGTPDDGTVVAIPLADAPRWTVSLARPAGRQLSVAARHFADAVHDQHP